MFAAGLAACAPQDSVSGSTESLVTAGPQVYLAPTFTPGNEPHAAFVTGGLLPDTLVIQYNGPAGSTFSWAWVGPGATTGALCNASVGCGLGGGPVALPVGVGRFDGDPQVVSDRRGDAVFVQNGRADPRGPISDKIVASLSFDGGRTIANTVVVNEGNCLGEEDQPTAAFDATVDPPVLWVAWRHKGAGTYGVCTRHGTLNRAAATIDWALAPSGRSEAAPVAVPITNILFGVGGLVIQAGDGAATIINQGSDQYIGFPSACPRARGTFTMNWYSTTTWDGGGSWVPTPTPIYASTSVPRCSANQLAPALRNFAFVRDDDGVYYVAVHNAAGQITVVQSESQGVVWRNPVGIARPAATGEVFFPTLATAAGGHLALSFYATDTANTTAAVYVTATSDGRNLGAWETAVRVGAPMRLDPTNSRQFGDYMGLAAFPMASCTSPTPPQPGTAPPAATAFYVPAWTDVTRATAPFLAEISWALVARVPPP